VSKTQDKRARRKEEARIFVAARLSQNLAMFEQNFEAGVQMYEANKDKLSDEERTEIEAQMALNRKLIDELKSKVDTPAEA
jgi:hypothetical protein